MKRRIMKKMKKRVEMVKMRSKHEPHVLDVVYVGEE